MFSLYFSLSSVSSTALRALDSEHLALGKMVKYKPVLFLLLQTLSDASYFNTDILESFPMFSQYIYIKYSDAYRRIYLR